MSACVNLFVAWFLAMQIFMSQVLAEVGTGVLFVLGVPLHEEFGWLVGALFLAAILFIVRLVLGELPLGTGKPGGKGYELGHGMLLVSSLLAFCVYVLPVFTAGISSQGMLMLLSSLKVGFMIAALGLFGFGLSFVYQSAQPDK